MKRRKNYDPTKSNVCYIRRRKRGQRKAPAPAEFTPPPTNQTPH